MAKFIHDMIAACPQPDRKFHTGSKAVWMGQHLMLAYFNGGGYWNRGWNPVPASFEVHWANSLEDAGLPGFAERQRAANKLTNPRPTTKAGVLDLVAKVKALDDEIAANIDEWRREAAELEQSNRLAAEDERRVRRRQLRMEQNAGRLKDALAALVDAVERSIDHEPTEVLEARQDARRLLMELDKDA